MLLALQVLDLTAAPGTWRLTSAAPERAGPDRDGVGDFLEHGAAPAGMRIVRLPTGP